MSMDRPNPAIRKQWIDKFLEAKVKNKQNFFIHPSYSTELKMLRSLALGHAEEAAAALEDINRHPRARLAKDPIRSLKNSLIGTCTLFTRAIISGGVHPESAYSLSDVFILQIEETTDARALERLEYDMLYAFADALNSERQPVYGAIVNRAIAFIHDEVLNDLPLSRIARHVNVHPSYLSGLFKKETGMTVREYVIRTRIEDSKYFLTHSDLPIVDIAVLFRFCSQSYYARQFKRYVSMTPLQYRNKYRGRVGA